MTANPSFGPAEPAARPAPRRLFRSQRDRVIAGICGGIAESYAADPALVRIATVVIGLLTGVVPMILLYVIAAIVIPEGEPSGTPIARPAGSEERRLIAPVILGLVLVIVGLSAFARQVLGVTWDTLWPLGVIALGFAVVLWAVRRPEAPQA